MDPTMGTELVMYFGEHPEEAKTLTYETLAANEKEWPTALAKAGMKLGQIHAKIASRPPAKGAPAPAPKGGPAPTPITTKKVTTASKPPSIIRGGTAPPKFDLTSDEDAKDVGKWMRERERQLAAQQNGRR